MEVLTRRLRVEWLNSHQFLPPPECGFRSWFCFSCCCSPFYISLVFLHSLARSLAWWWMGTPFFVYQFFLASQLKKLKSLPTIFLLVPSSKFLIFFLFFFCCLMKKKCEVFLCVNPRLHTRRLRPLISFSPLHRARINRLFVVRHSRSCSASREHRVAFEEHNNKKGQRHSA